MSRSARVFCALVAIAVAAGGVGVAAARPVRIGRLTTLPWGFREAHPCATLACDAGRGGRVRGRFPAVTPVRTWRHVTSEPVADLGHAHPLVLAGELVVVAGVGGIEGFTRGGTRAFHAAYGVAAMAHVPALTPGDDLVVATTRGDVLLVTREGVVRARARVPGGVRGAPLALADGTIVVGTSDALVGLDAELGPLFEVPLRGGASGAPVLTREGRVAVGAGADVVVTDAEGRGASRSELAARIDDHVAVAPDGTLWARVATGELVAIDPSGHARTRGAAGRADAFAPVVAADGSLRVFVRTSAGRTALAALAPTGRVLWERALDGVPRGVTVDAEGTSIAAMQAPLPTGPGTTNVAPIGELVAIDPHGEVLWRVVTEGVPFDAPVRGDAGALYVLVARERTALECYAAPEPPR